MDLLVASLTALCGSQLVHLCDALLELLVLALFVRVSLVLFVKTRVRELFCRRCSNGRDVDFGGSEGVGESSYLALPGKVVLVVSAAVQRDQEVGAGVSVGDGKSCVRHLLAGSSCRFDI
jgi:hypothetical protein